MPQSDSDTNTRHRRPRSRSPRHPSRSHHRDFSQPPRHATHRSPSRSPFRNNRLSARHHDSPDRALRHSHDMSHRQRQHDRPDTSREHDSRSHRHRRHRHHGRDRSRSRSSSPRPKKRRHRSPSRSSRRRSPPPSPLVRSRKPLPPQEESFRRNENPVGEHQEYDKEAPNFGATGILAAEANRVLGTNIVLKYSEPADARLPPSKQDWRLYIFKGEEISEEVPIFNRSCWLMGRERSVVDLMIEHPSASKQHAVIQFRHVTKKNEFGDKKGAVKPYLIDLDSSNGTMLNGSRIVPSRFIEIQTGDVMTVGKSEREYVFVLPPPS